MKKKIDSLLDPTPRPMRIKIQTYDTIKYSTEVLYFDASGGYCMNYAYTDEHQTGVFRHLNIVSSVFANAVKNHNERLDAINKERKKIGTSPVDPIAVYYENITRFEHKHIDTSNIIGFELHTEGTGSYDDHDYDQFLYAIVLETEEDVQKRIEFREKELLDEKNKEEKRKQKELLRKKLKSDPDYNNFLKLKSKFKDVT